MSLPNYRCFLRPGHTDPHRVAVIIKQNGSTLLVDKCDKYTHQDKERLSLTVKTNSNVTFDLIVSQTLGRLHACKCNRLQLQLLWNFMITDYNYFFPKCNRLQLQTTLQSNHDYFMITFDYF